MGVKDFFVAAFLAVNGFWDIKNRRILMWSVPIFAAIGIFLGVMGETPELYPAALGLVPGLFLLLTGQFSGQAVGFGDGLAVLVIGIYLGLMDTLCTLLLGLVPAALFSLALLVFCHSKKDREIPFLPFLLLGFLLERIGVVIG